MEDEFQPHIARDKAVSRFNMSFKGIMQEHQHALSIHGNKSDTQNNEGQSGFGSSISIFFRNIGISTEAVVRNFIHQTENFFGSAMTAAIVAAIFILLLYVLLCKLSPLIFRSCIKRRKQRRSSKQVAVVQYFVVHGKYCENECQIFLPTNEQKHDRSHMMSMHSPAQNS